MNQIKCDLCGKKIVPNQSLLLGYGFSFHWKCATEHNLVEDRGNGYYWRGKRLDTAYEDNGRIIAPRVSKGSGSDVPGFEWRCEGCDAYYAEYCNGCVHCWDYNLSEEENRIKFPNRGVRLVPIPKPVKKEKK